MMLTAYHLLDPAQLPSWVFRLPVDAVSIPKSFQQIFSLLKNVIVHSAVRNKNPDWHDHPGHIDDAYSGGWSPDRYTSSVSGEDAYKLHIREVLGAFSVPLLNVVFPPTMKSGKLALRSFVFSTDLPPGHPREVSPTVRALLPGMFSFWRLKKPQKRPCHSPCSAPLEVRSHVTDATPGGIL